ncbi:hypothetical protein LTR27_006670 [Elasticomyces elasticus]|nr:hypothetical protein LTR27_006670 [Elasticomyces elasticus]
MGSQRFATAKALDQSRRRLFTLPAELRNEIYELAFTMELDKQIELFSAVPPSNSLILTCRQVCDEAAGIYRQAYRAFWTMGHFMLTVSKRELVTASNFIQAATRDWEQMRNIMVRSNIFAYHYMPEHGVWECRSECPTARRFGTMVVPKHTDATSMLPNKRLRYKAHGTLDEALLKAEGRRGRMVNQLRTFVI